MRRMLIAIVMILMGVLWRHPELVLSCAATDARNDLATRDAALVGKILSVHDVPEGRVFRVRVTHDMRRNLPEIVDILSGSEPGVSSGAFGGSVGERIGVFLYQEEGWWRASGCSRVAPNALIDAAQPLPPPDGRGRMAFVITGRLGDVSTIGLDDEGRVLAYGRDGGGKPALCPGGSLLVELFHAPSRHSPGYVGHATIATRDPETFSIVRSHRVRTLDTDNLTQLDLKDLVCLDRLAPRVVALGIESGRGTIAKVVDIRRDIQETLYSQSVQAAALSPGAAWIAEPNGNLVRLDLSTGRSTTIAILPTDLLDLDVTPDERLLVATGGEFDEGGHDSASGTILVVDLQEPSRRTERTIEIYDGTTSYPTVRWLDRTTVGHWTRSGLELLDADLATRGVVDEIHFPVAPRLDGDRLYGFARGEGSVSTFVALPIAGEPQVLNAFESYVFGDVLRVPQDVRIKPRPAWSPARVTQGRPLAVVERENSALPWLVFLLVAGVIVIAVRVRMRNQAAQAAAPPA